MKNIYTIGKKLEVTKLPQRYCPHCEELVNLKAIATSKQDIREDVGVAMCAKCGKNLGMIELTDIY